MTTTTELEDRFARFVEHHVLYNERMALDELCTGRPELAVPLGDLVERYLALTHTLDGEPDEPPAALPGAAPLPHFDGFQTIERIGAGGMGEVFKLRDVRLDRIVAGKVVRRDAADWKNRLEAFLHEARALALFSDRRIVQVFEFRPDADPPVIIMELVDGFELGRIGPSLEYSQRARVMIEICEAVQHAHGLGLQHRDLKPSNIMLERSGGVKVMDYGIARAQHLEGVTTTGAFLGTPYYAAPETVEGATEPRSDIYSLGVVLFEMLTGSLPFRGENAFAVLRSHCLTPPPAPSSLNYALTEDLDRLVLRLLSKEPSGRPTAEELLNLLSDHLRRASDVG